MRAAAVASAIVLAGGIAAPPALAANATRAELVSLAERAAAGDEAALAELEGVSSVEGAPVDLAAALEGAEGDELEARLREVARSGAAIPDGSLPDSATARERAEEVLGSPPEPPAAEGGGGGDFLSELGVPLWLAVAIALAVIVAGALLGRSAARRRVFEALAEVPIGEETGSRKDPRELERRAEEAERRGEFVAAVRLRFLAGLARLDASGARRVRPALTAAGAARELRSPRLAELARVYDEVVFGGLRARREEAEAAREGWRAVISEAPR